MSKLVIVESPAKAKTIQKYLGKGYEVIASMGHIRDLPKSTLGVDIENNFKPKYIAIRGKEDVVKKLKTGAKNAERVFLATDPDREGEAIAWHLAHLLKLDLNDDNRVTFNEITKTGIKYGMAHPRHLDFDRINAQQARRILDRIVGYKLSPFLWKKVRSGLSAGRVQSVAVRLIVDRENEINAFTSDEYWSIDAKLMMKGSRKAFAAKFYGKDGEKIDLHNHAETAAILAELGCDLSGAPAVEQDAETDETLRGLPVSKDVQFVVDMVKKGTRRKSPAPPFTTSTLQQEASRKLGFQARRTMKAAQELYEGVSVGKMGQVGLITYMRTDSLRISQEASDAAAAYIEESYGKQYLPQSRRVYKSKSNAQDAHEAIRPTMPNLSPAQVREDLTADQYKLYKLIWERFIASQMANALLNTMQCDILANGYTFKASGYSVKFDGYTVLYEEGKDESSEESGALPDLKEGDILRLKSLDGAQHFTQPPARFTEASLIKALEENGIGRPSTYAPTITTILSRGYVEREAKALKPTLLGEVTTQLIREHFADIVSVEFTAGLEKQLDAVEEGKGDWVKVLDRFYGGFAKSLEEAEKVLGDTKIKIPDEVTDVICEKCGRNMVIKNGRYGKFLACPGFPECRNTKKIVQETPGICPKCGGKILAKKSKHGKAYYGCEHNPTCDFMTWDEPLAEKCPKCGGSLFKKRGRQGKIYCVKEGCGYERSLKGAQDNESDKKQEE